VKEQIAEVVVLLDEPNLPVVVKDESGSEATDPGVPSSVDKFLTE
jgi:hypothetical protein